jgi:chromosome partitioning protein
MPEVRQARIRVGLVANRVRERTLAARELAQHASGLEVPLLGTLRDAQAYVRAAAFGRTVFDYDTPLSRDHATDWVPLLRWIANPAAAAVAVPAPALQASLA